MSTPTTEQITAHWLKCEHDARMRFHASSCTSTDQIKGMSGMDFIQHILDGKLPFPPISKTLDFFLAEGEPGRIVFQGRPSFEHYNPMGGVHGGYFCTLLDSALGCAVHSVLPQGIGYTTVEVKVNMLRAMTADTGPVRAEAKIIQVGRQIGTAEGRIVDPSGKIYAHATTTCLIFPLP